MAAEHHHHHQHQQGPPSMARISFSPLVVDASGSVSDTVFAKWKGRPYIRSRVTPANPQTPDQVYQRAVMAIAVALYATLTAAIKAAWRTYATAYSITAANAFTKKNASTAVPNGDANYPRLDTRTLLAPQFSPPDQVIGNLSNFAAVTGAGAAGTIDVSWSAAGWTAASKVYLWAMQDDAVNNIIGEPEVVAKEVTANQGSTTLTGLDPDHTYIVVTTVYAATEAGYTNSLAVRGVTPKAE